MGCCCPGREFNSCRITLQSSCKSSCVKIRRFQPVFGNNAAHFRHCNCLDGWEVSCARLVGGSVGRGGITGHFFHCSCLARNFTVDIPPCVKAWLSSIPWGSWVNPSVMLIKYSRHLCWIKPPLLCSSQPVLHQNPFPEIYRQDSVHSNPCPACTLIPWCSASGTAFDNFLKNKMLRCQQTRENNENARAEHKNRVKAHQKFCLCPLSIASSLQRLHHPQKHFAGKSSHHCSTRLGPINYCPFMTCYDTM